MSASSSSVGHQRLKLLLDNRHSLRLLRGFQDAELEQEYGVWLRAELATVRIALLIVPMFVLLTAPLYGRYLLDGDGTQSEQHILWLRLLEIGFTTPACFAAIVTLRRFPTRPLATHLFLVAGLVVFVSTAIIRWVTGTEGGHLSAELVMLTPLAYASVGGVRNYLMLPLVWFCTTFFVGAEIAFQSGAALARSLLGIGIMAWLAVMNAVVVDRLSRRSWLDRRISELSGMLDGITRLPNRAWFNRDAAALIRQLHRMPAPIAVFLIDLDHFKKLNDAHGHAAGDAALTAVGSLLLTQFGRRPFDLMARYGGEEFVLVLYDTPLERAREFAEKLITAIHFLRIPNKNTPEGRLTASVGVWQGVPRRTQQMEDLLASADEALYAAKEAGRNRFAVVRGD